MYTFTFLNISFHSKVYSVHGRKMVDITRQMERNAHLGISDLYLVEDKDCKDTVESTRIEPFLAENRVILD